MMRLLPLSFLFFLFQDVTDAFTATTMKRSMQVKSLTRREMKWGARGRARNRNRDKDALVMMPSGTPMVPYQPPGSDYAQFVDIYSRLYRERIMLLGNFIDQKEANQIISILLYLREEDPHKKITLYFNCPGAELRPALAVYDAIMQCKQDCDISTLNLGLATGMAAMLCGAGTKGMRFAMPNARFLLQRVGMEQPFQGQASDIALEVANVKKNNDNMERELAMMTGRSIPEVHKDMKRDFYLSSDEAVIYGLIDHVLVPKIKGIQEPIRYQRDPWTGRQVPVYEEQNVDLGVFEGDEEQRYQNQKGGGFGGNTNSPNGIPGEKDDDDDDDYWEKRISK